MKTVFRFLLAALLPVLASCHDAHAQDLSEAAIAQLMDDSFVHFNAERHREALEGFLKVAEQTKARRTESERQAYICSQTMAVTCYQHLEQYEKSYLLAESVLNEGNLSDAEKKDLTGLYVYNGYLTALDYIESSSSRYAEARDIFDRIWPYADDEMLKRIQRQRPTSWYMEGVEYQKSRLYEQALPCMENARCGYHDVGLPDYETVALCRTGELKRELCDWSGSIHAYREAEKLAGSDSDKMQILIEQWKVCNAAADYKEMWDISERMESLASSSEDAGMRFAYYSFRGKQAELQGSYSMAERWYLHNETLLPMLDNPARTHKHHVDMRSLYTKAGRWDDAVRYALLSKEDFHLYRNPSEAAYYIPYLSIADIYRRKGDSLKCFQNIDTLFRAVPLTDEPRQLVYFYSTRAMAFADFGDFDRALQDYRTADSLLATKYDPTDEDRVMLLAHMGGTENHLQNYPESERLYTEYAGMVGTIYGESSMDYINAVGILANAEAFAGHMEKAALDYTDASSRLKQQVRMRWPYLTSAEREAYWKSAAKLLHNMTPFAIKAGEYHTPFTETCYNGLILTKAFLLESEQSTYGLIKRNGTEEDLESFSAIQYLLEKIKVWERDGAKYTDSILVASAQVRRMESALSDRCRVYGDATGFMDVDYAEVKQALGDRDVLIDFTDFVSKERGRVYAAYVTDSRQDFPLLKELFEERSIDSLNISHPCQYCSGTAGGRIHELLWKPLKDNVPEGATVYYVPSRLLFQIAPESIPAEDGTLLGNHYHFVRLSSARELVRYSHKLEVGKIKGHKDAVLYGGLEYSMDDESMCRQSGLHDVPRTLAFRGSENLVRGDSLFHELPGSMEEITAICRVLKKARLEVAPFSGKEGTEESFLCLDGQSPCILHLATHGFYYTPDAAEKVNYLHGYTDAMSLSGLVLSGGNAAWLGHELPDNVLGGIVTASDVARMDLSGVEMVVLSACHSGRGEATPEGLYGLQRAFKKAGVKTMVMSLWAESDVVGPEFMTALYENLVKTKWDKHKAFDRTKKYIRARYPDSPSYWAGFVMLD